MRLAIITIITALVFLFVFLTIVTRSSIHHPPSEVVPSTSNTAIAAPAHSAHKAAARKDDAPRITLEEALLGLKRHIPRQDGEMRYEAVYSRGRDLVFEVSAQNIADGAAFQASHDMPALTRKYHRALLANICGQEAIVELFRSGLLEQVEYQVQDKTRQVLMRLTYHPNNCL